MNSLINSKVIDILGILKQGALSILSQGKTDIPTQTTYENSFRESKAKKTQPGLSETLATENQFQRAVDSQSVPFAHPIPEVKVTRSAFIEKYEMGSGKNKINVRIFKEPTAEFTNIKP